MDQSLKKHEPFEGKKFPFRMVILKGTQNLVIGHYHEHIEFIKVLEGTVLMNIDGREFCASSGDIVYINSCAFHSVTDLSGANAKICGMIFDKMFLSGILEGFDTQYLYQLFTHSGKQYVFNPSQPLWNDLNCCIENSYEEYSQQQICHEMMIKSYIYQMMSLILRYYQKCSSANDALGISESSHLHIIPIIEYINKHYMEKIYTRTLCNLVNMSEFHFCRFFKKAVGITVTEYITDIRIEMATKLMSDFALSITQISEQTGFCNVNYFIKVFKRKKGLSPKKFRNFNVENGN